MGSTAERCWALDPRHKNGRKRCFGGHAIGFVIHPEVEDGRYLPCLGVVCVEEDYGVVGSCGIGSGEGGEIECGCS